MSHDSHALPAPGLRRDHLGPVTVLTLDRPDSRNALDDALIRGLTATLREEAERARVIVLRAVPGVRVFSAGHDISELPTDPAQAVRWENPLEELLATVPTLPVPVIATVEGSVWGGACNLVVACDLLFATESAAFAITPAKLGVPYAAGGIAQFAAALPAHMAKQLYLTAEPISAERAYQVGLVNGMYPDEPAMTAAVMALAEVIAARAPITLAQVKSAFAGLVEHGPHAQAAAARSDELTEQAWQSNDYQRALAAFKERRAPEFLGD